MDMLNTLGALALQGLGLLVQFVVLILSFFLVLARELMNLLHLS